ncbi:MAG: YibE/F family protein [Candidatus Paceibacterota bacterium]
MFNLKSIYILLLLIVSLWLISPTVSIAQELHNDLQAILEAKVIEVIDNKETSIAGTPNVTATQTLRVEITSGDMAGRFVTISNDYIELEAGDKFFLYYLKTINGDEIYTVGDYDRRLPILLLTGLFILTVLIFGGLQGLRSLLSLFGSFVVILYILVPGLLHGFNPILLSAVVAGTILFFAIFFTHGFNKESVVAFSGTMIAVGLTIILSIVAVAVAHLTGFASEDAVYLNIRTEGSLDFTGLLLGAIIIGVLGVLDDIAITQAAVVTELYNSGANLKPRAIYTKAIRVGKEHVGALVNTLVLAYTGAALPLLLLFSGSNESFLMIINREMFATEIVRTITGSIGLILTVPIVTLLAVYFLQGYKPKHQSGHTHSHH